MVSNSTKYAKMAKSIWNRSGNGAIIAWKISSTSSIWLKQNCGEQISKLVNRHTIQAVYNELIQGALREGHIVQEAALASKLCGDYANHWGDKELAKGYWDQAQQQYGCTAPIADNLFLRRSFVMLRGVPTPVAVHPLSTFQHNPLNNDKFCQ